MFGQGLQTPGRGVPPAEGTAWTPALGVKTDFFEVLFQNLPPLRWTLGVPHKRKIVLYTDAQYSVDGRKGLGVILADTDSGINYICGGEVPPELLKWITSLRDAEPHVNHCELLAVLAAVMTFPDLLHDRDVLLFTDNLTVLKCLVHGYMRTPELAAMSNGLHLLLAGLLSRCYSLHVPGLSIPADIPSRVPSIAVGGNWVLDPVKVRAGKTGAADEDTLHKIAAQHRHMVLPSVELQGSGEGRIRSPARDVWLLFDCSLPAGAGIGAALSSHFHSSSDVRPGVAALAAELHSPLLGRFARMPNSFELHRPLIFPMVLKEIKFNEDLLIKIVV